MGQENSFAESVPLAQPLRELEAQMHKDLPAGLNNRRIALRWAAMDQKTSAFLVETLYRSLAAALSATQGSWKSKEEIENTQALYAYDLRLKDAAGRELAMQRIEQSMRTKMALGQPWKIAVVSDDASRTEIESYLSQHLPAELLAGLANVQIAEIKGKEKEQLRAVLGKVNDIYDQLKALEIISQQA